MHLWQFILAHKEAFASIAVYHIASAMIDNLPMPDQQSGKFYRWFFGTFHAIAANWIRAYIGVRGGPSNGVPKV